MPVASSSRRRTRITKQSSSDRIEEDNPTQQGEDVDGDEEEQPKPSTRRAKGKARANTLQQETVGVEDDVEEDENDYKNLPDQPLSKSDAAKLKGLALDWSQIRKGIHQPSFNQLRDIAIALADTTEGDEAEGGLAELDSIMKTLVDIDQEMIAHEQTLDDIYQMLYQNEVVSDALARYDNGVESKANEYDKKTTRQKYAKSEPYVSFKQGIYEVYNPDTPMPPIKESIPKEDGDDSDDDDDLEVGGITQDYNCPLTLTTLVDPMKSPCGHTFSGEAIREFFGNARGAKKCPGAGCNKSFTLSQLTPNTALEKSIRLALRRAKRQEGDEDSDEVIE